MSTTSQWILFLFLFCVFVLPLSATSLRRAFPVDLSSFTDQEIYKIDSEVDAKQESFEPYETSLYPVYQQLVDGPTIYDVLNSPAIEQVKSRKDAFSVDEPAFRPRYDSITHISDRHDEQRMNVYKRFSQKDYLPNPSRFIQRDVCSSQNAWLGPLQKALNEQDEVIHLQRKQWYWVSLCNNKGKECFGMSSYVSSSCIQETGWVMAWGRRYVNEANAWHRISVPTCCSCVITYRMSKV